SETSKLSPEWLAKTWEDKVHDVATILWGNGIRLHQSPWFYICKTCADNKSEEVFSSFDSMRKHVATHIKNFRYTELKSKVASLGFAKNALPTEMNKIDGLKLHAGSICGSLCSKAKVVPINGKGKRPASCQHCSSSLVACQYQVVGQTKVAIRSGAQQPSIPSHPSWLSAIPTQQAAFQTRPQSATPRSYSTPATTQPHPTFPQVQAQVQQAAETQASVMFPAVPADQGLPRATQSQPFKAATASGTLPTQPMFRPLQGPGSVHVLLPTIPKPAAPSPYSQPLVSSQRILAVATDNSQAPASLPGLPQPSHQLSPASPSLIEATPPPQRSYQPSDGMIPSPSLVEDGTLHLQPGVHQIYAPISLDRFETAELEGSQYTENTTHRVYSPTSVFPVDSWNAARLSKVFAIGQVADAHEALVISLLERRFNAFKEQYHLSTAMQKLLNTVYSEGETGDRRGKFEFGNRDMRGVAKVCARLVFTCVRSRVVAEGNEICHLGLSGDEAAAVDLLQETLNRTESTEKEKLGAVVDLLLAVAGRKTHFKEPDHKTPLALFVFGTSLDQGLRSFKPAATITKAIAELSYGLKLCLGIALEGASDEDAKNELSGKLNPPSVTSAFGCLQSIHGRLAKEAKYQLKAPNVYRSGDDW
ncbi:hypothetical protein HDV05_008267, partial [Chytridiales sp. JEL 0842]